MDETILAIAQIVLAAALAFLTWKLYRATQKYANQAEEQSKIMKDQSNLRRQVMDYDRLSKQYGRLEKEMASFVSPLYARRNEQNFFLLQERPQRFAHRVPDLAKAAEVDFINFWEGIDQYSYLNHSNYLQIDLNNYNAAISAFFTVQPNTPERETLQKTFIERIRPQLIQAIEKRFNELDKKLKEIEIELQKFEKP